MFIFALSNDNMLLTPDNKLKKLIVIGDRILIKPLQPEQRTASGLYLPPGVQERKKFSKDMLSKPVQAMPSRCQLKMSPGKEMRSK